MHFDYHIPTKIIFGRGRLKELATEELPGSKALIVITNGQSMKRLGYLNQVTQYLKENGVDSVLFDKVLPNPTLAHVSEAAELARRENCDMVVGLGGGSAIDSAKAIALAATNPGNYWEYVKGREVENAALPIVAIPTTAGTGTESDPWTVITNLETNEKIGFGIKQLFPTLSIVDPELMVSVPANLTAYQGMDAFLRSIPSGGLPSFCRKRSRTATICRRARKWLGQVRRPVWWRALPAVFPSIRWSMPCRPFIRGCRTAPVWLRFRYRILRIF